MLTHTPKCVGYIVSSHVLKTENTDIVTCSYNNIMHDGGTTTSTIHGEIINEVWNRFCMYAHEIVSSYTTY